MKFFLKKHRSLFMIAFLIILFSIIRYFLVDGYPIFPLTGAGEDDALMVKFAYTINEGKWLGNYEYNTLIETRQKHEKDLTEIDKNISVSKAEKDPLKLR